MFQKFSTNTLMSGFIKNLLSTQEIPLLDSVFTGDTLIEGCTYLYKRYIIRCVESGRLDILETDILYPSDIVYPSVFIFPKTGMKIARFKVIDYFDENTHHKYTYNYHSTCNEYDSQTHLHLGNYLRFIKGYYELDLMPFYNCFTNEYAEDISLNYLPATTTRKYIKPSDVLKCGTETKVEEGLYVGGVELILTNTNESSTDKLNSDFKVLSVPIKFNKSYTIAIECATPVQMRAVVMNKSGMILTQDGKTFTDDLNTSSIVYNSLSFNSPVQYRVETFDKLMYSQERNLKLLIQLPVNNTSSIVILEGDYTKNDMIKTDKNQVRKYPEIINPALLTLNNQRTYAFSNRLIEYLLLNVVTPSESISGNIKRFQEALANQDSIYFKEDKNPGIWNNSMRAATMRLVKKYHKEYLLKDQDGYLNRDLENMLYQKGAYDT